MIHLSLLLFPLSFSLFPPPSSFSPPLHLYIRPSSSYIYLTLSSIYMYTQYFFLFLTFSTLYTRVFFRRGVEKSFRFNRVSNGLLSGMTDVLLSFFFVFSRQSTGLREPGQSNCLDRTLDKRISDETQGFLLLWWWWWWLGWWRSTGWFEKGTFFRRRQRLGVRVKRDVFHGTSG